MFSKHLTFSAKPHVFLGVLNEKEITFFKKIVFFGFFIGKEHNIFSDKIETYTKFTFDSKTAQDTYKTGFGLGAIVG